MSVACVYMCCVYVYVLILICRIFLHFYENNRIFYENNRHIFQELKNRIMGEKKHNLSGPNPQPLRIFFKNLTLKKKFF